MGAGIIKTASWAPLGAKVYIAAVWGSPPAMELSLKLPESQANHMIKRSRSMDYSQKALEMHKAWRQSPFRR